MGARHDNRVIAERIDDDHSTMHHDDAGFEQFFSPLMEFLGNGSRNQNVLRQLTAILIAFFVESAGALPPETSVRSVMC